MYIKLSCIKAKYCKKKMFFFFKNRPCFVIKPCKNHFDILFLLTFKYYLELDVFVYPVNMTW